MTLENTILSMQNLLNVILSCAICLNPLFFVGVFFFLIPFVLHVLYHLWFFKRCNSNKFFFFNKNYHHQIWSLPQKSWKYWSNKSSKMIGKMILSIYLKLAVNPRDAREILTLFLFIYYLLISERRNKYMELVSICLKLKII